MEVGFVFANFNPTLMVAVPAFSVTDCVEFTNETVGATLMRGASLVEMFKAVKPEDGFTVFTEPTLQIPSASVFDHAMVPSVNFLRSSLLKPLLKVFGMY